MLFKTIYRIISLRLFHKYLCIYIMKLYREDMIIYYLHLNVAIATNLLYYHIHNTKYNP